MTDEELMSIFDEAYGDGDRGNILIALRAIAEAAADDQRTSDVWVAIFAARQYHDGFAADTSDAADEHRIAAVQLERSISRSLMKRVHHA